MRGRAIGRLAATALTGGLVVALGVVALAPQAQTLFTAGHGPGTPIDLRPLSQRSVVYARDGSILTYLHEEQNRQSVTLGEVAPIVVDAIVDVEDERFWRHDGIDVRGMLRALYTNVQAGGIEQGGSTITQQLVKNTLLTSQRDATRKIKEASLAIRLEQQLSKQEILERYLNTVYFGNGAYGVEAAAETYFGKAAKELGVAEAALLAGLVRNPVGYDPFVHPDRARARRDVALARLEAHHHLSAPERAAAAGAPLPAQPAGLLSQPDGGVGYFIEEVKQQLLDDTRLGATPAERYDAVFNGGLQIHTTLDPRMEAAAIDAVNRGLPDTGGRFTAALVSVDPTSGAVRALVGGPGFEHAKFNLATQGHRQAGSSFKPFTLVAAIEAGISPKSTISGSSPCRIPNPGGEPDPWMPENYEGERGRGSMTLLDATANSVNCAYARLATIVGIGKVADAARRMGIATPLEPTPAMTLGGLRNGVTPLEMASAYATLAADGVHHRPYFIDRVVGRDGKAIFATDPSRGAERVISTQTARVATQVLLEPIRRGTATKARVRGHVVAGKTGTAQDHQDAWLVGYTPQLATAVWMGAPVGEVPMTNVGGIRVTGGSYPASIWSRFMTAALADLPAVAFPQPNPKLLPKATYLRLKGEKVSKSTTTTKSRARSRTGTTAGAGRRAPTTSRP